MIETSVLLKGSLSEAYQVFVTKPVRIFPLSLKWLTDPNRKLPEQKLAATIKPPDIENQSIPPPKKRQNLKWNPKKIGPKKLVTGSTESKNWKKLDQGFPPFRSIPPKKVRCLSWSILDFPGATRGMEHSRLSRLGMGDARHPGEKHRWGHDMTHDIFIYIFVTRLNNICILCYMYAPMCEMFVCAHLQWCMILWAHQTST